MKHYLIQFLHEVEIGCEDGVSFDDAVLIAMEQEKIELLSLIIRDISELSGASQTVIYSSDDVRRLWNSRVDRPWDS